MNKLTFTKNKLDNLHVLKGADRSVFYDEKVNGLAIRVTKTGVKSFLVYKKWQGRPLKITIGKYPDISIENARKEASKVINNLYTGVNPNKVKSDSRKDLSLKEAFNIYIEDYAKKHKKTWQYDVKQYERYLINYNNKKLTSLTVKEIELIHNKIRNNNGLYAANRLLAMLKTIFNQAIKWGLANSNPTKGVRKFKEKSRDRFIKPKELKQFFKALEQEENLTMKNYFYMLLYTGARKRNLISMRWDEIDFKQKVWRIPETKNGESLDVPLVDEAIKLLKKMYKSACSDYVFPSETSKSGHIEEPKRAWSRLLERAKLDDLRIHDVRRTLGSYQAMAGASLNIIGKSLGHKSLQATQIYSRLNNDPIRSSMSTAIEQIKGHSK